MPAFNRRVEPVDPGAMPICRTTWARQITASWRRTIESIIHVGQLLAQAKQALPHGQFQRMVETDLPFGPRAARQLMQVARHPALTKRKHASALPASWYTLYQLSRLPEDQLQRAIRAGDVRADMSRAETMALLERSRDTGVEPASGSASAARSLTALLDEGETYGCIYADPPWQYDNGAARGAAQRHYRTLPLDEIAALPVAQLAARNAHLHLWSPAAFLEEAFQVLRAWGFQPRSQLVWIKDQMGAGNYWRVCHEILLLGVRGSARFRDRTQRSWIQLPRGAHSAKPAEVRRIIERVSPGPRLELFARERVRGWTSWGDQLSAQPRVSPVKRAPSRRSRPVTRRASAKNARGSG